MQEINLLLMKERNWYIILAGKRVGKRQLRRLITRVIDNAETGSLEE
jgi:hypothetical protein